MKILIVDDNKMILELLEDLIEKSGSEVVSATNGEEALEKLKADRFDMIISDILMPVMDGFQLCKEVKGDEKLSNIPFVFYSATYTTEEDEKFALSLGASKFIRKPTEPDTFIRIISEILEEAKSGALAPSKVDPLETSLYLTEYNNRVVAKLENKMAQLEVEIIERKQAEEELSKAKEYSHNLVDSSLDMIISVDQNRRIVEFNKAAEKTFGYKKEEILGKNVDILYADSEEGLNVHNTTKKGGQLFVEIMNKRKNGELFPTFLAASIMRDENGDFMGVMGVSRDITEHKQAEEALRENEEKLKRMFESVTDGIVVTDLNGNIMEVNEAAVRLYGSDSKEKLIGRSAFEFIDETDQAQVMEVLKSALEDGQIRRNVEITFLTEDGREYFAEVSSALLKDASGSPVGFIAITRDITERKRMEDEARKMHQGLVEAHEKLQRAYEEEKLLRDKLIQSERLASLGQIGAKIAHEINNPLTVISGRAQIGRMKDIDEELKKTFALIEQESMRISNITSTYMNLSKPTPPKKEKVNLNEVVEETVDSLIITGEIKHYKIYKNLQSDLPEVIGDYDRLVQVFRDLIVNALYAMADSEEKILTLRSSISKDGKFAEVSIHDTGSGIEKEKLDKIFEIYYTTKPDGLGTGLGLVVVKDIVEKQHRGKVLVESEIGKGTTFTVQLPLKIESKRKRILVADDEAYIRELFVTFLEGCGMEVFEACNGREALENFEKVQPDIILSDIEMPIMDGFELVEEIRLRKPEQKIILMTGFYYEPRIKEKLEKYNIPFFTKPADLDAVWKMISDELKK